jgi:hypothetical protein
MKNDHLLQFNPSAFLQFVKFTASEKQWHLRNRGLLVDKDDEGENYVNLYFIDGFFVEEILSKTENRLVDVIPYTKGFKVDSFVEVKHIIVSKLNSI